MLSPSYYIRNCHYNFPCKNLEFHRVLSSSSILVVINLLIIIMVSGYSNAQLEGSDIACTEEFSEVYVAGISGDPCITCSCMNQEVTCVKEQCPNMEGCHYKLYTILVQPDELSCCDTCKGCYFDGQDYKSGTEWVDRNNPCQYYKCQAGVVTSSFKQCQMTCSNPTYIPGQCCPICSGEKYKSDKDSQIIERDIDNKAKGCYVGGNTYLNGETFPSPEDSCSTCTCRNGSVQCERKACPVLNCLDRYIHTPPGQCCPNCTGIRQVYDLGKKACFFKNEVEVNGMVLSPDNCTDCECIEGTMVCQRKVCPPIVCPRGHFVIYDKSSCCPKCERVKRSCKFKYKNYKHGKVWNPDECTKCSCMDGLVRCQVHQCSNDIMQCPKNTKLQYVPGKCCPECVDNDAVCTVFGDPHYRTFDGAIFNFQGTCNYILARDCVSQDFSIHVRNDARLTNDFAWTKSVSIRMKDTRVYLLQNNRIKVNRKRVEIPYDGHGIKISGSSHTVTVKTSHGVKVIWDGDSYLEVSVPPAYKNNMCGLCGNYNNNHTDDMIGRDGQKYFDPDDFGETWQVGKKLLCLSTTLSKSERKKSSCDSRDDRRRARKECDILQNGVFELCKNVVDAAPYYESCMTDVCDCQEGKKCACESIKAFVRECQRSNVQIDWSQRLCEDKVCPANSRWSKCANPCPKTCDNLKENTKCRTLCQQGCECQSGFVFHIDKCIKPGLCPAMSKKDKTEKDRKKKNKKNKKNRQKKKDKKNKNDKAVIKLDDDDGQKSNNDNSNKEKTSTNEGGSSFNIFGKDLFKLLSGEV